MVQDRRRRHGAHLLLAESPLIVLPTLAEVIGLNAAMLLQQVHFLGLHESAGWVWRSHRTWRQTEFRFCSEDTIKRGFGALAHQGLVEVSQARSTDRSNRYRVNYPRVERLLPGVQIHRAQWAPAAATCLGPTGQKAPLPNEKEGPKESKESAPPLPLPSASRALKYDQVLQR